MPKNAYFGGKAVMSPQCRGLCPRTPVGFQITEVTHSKCFGFAFPRFRAYFLLQTLQFLSVGAKNIFCPRRSGTLQLSHW